MDLPKIYSEVYAILEILGNEYINKIPTKLYNYIVAEKESNIKIHYDINKPLNEQPISEETILFISYLNLQYWCDEEQKQELLKIYKQNDDKIEEELRQEYNVDNLFKNRANNETIGMIEEERETQLIEYKTKSYIKKLFENVINAICFWKK